MDFEGGFGPITPEERAALEAVRNLKFYGENESDFNYGEQETEDAEGEVV